MKIRRINENTISCIISPEDMRANGIRIDDFFERKKEAVDFIRGVVAQAAISENFDLEGEFTTMRVSVLPDHSLSLLITREDTKEGAAKEVRRIAKNIFEAIAAKAAEKAEEEGGEMSVSDRLIKALFADSNESGAGNDTDDSGNKEKDTDGQDVSEDGAEHKADAYMFSFYSVRDAMDCCRLFADAGPVDSSFYYLIEDDTYFLIIRRNGSTPAGLEKRVLSANEFGELVTSIEQYISYVTEHGLCIASEKAVEMFLGAMPGTREPKRRRGASGSAKTADRKGNGDLAAEDKAPGPIGTGQEADQ